VIALSDNQIAAGDDTTYMDSGVELQ
jgi:hypothetical protein